MAKYHIRDFEVLSGIKANTIRMWERRYHLFNPERTDTNIRYYSDEDLVKLLNIALLSNRGHRISALAEMSDQQLKKQVEEIIAKENRFKDDYQERFVLSMLQMDEEGFMETLEESIRLHGMENTYAEKVFPFFERIGVLWQSGAITPVQEHFVSNLLRQKLFSETNTLTYNPEAPVAVAFLPEGENYKLSLLFYTFLLRKEGYKTIYLGASVPVKDVITTLKSHSFEILLTAFIASISGLKLRETIEQLAEAFPDKKILLTGHQLKKINFPLANHVTVVSNAKRLYKLLKD
jgi:DNA-binding transcriptional MerR regulator